MSGVSVRAAVKDASHIGEARRKALALAEGLAFSSAQSGKAALAATEMASNLVKHGNGGELLFRALRRTGALGERRAGLEILALDRGNGILDVNRALEDGYSTAGSPGTGLGAVRRLADLFDIYSRPGKGAAVLAQIWAGPALVRTPPEAFETGAVCVPYPGETVCGDGQSVLQRPRSIRMMMADGLGHGQYASEASAQAIRTCEENPDLGPGELIAAIHGALGSTRGAAAAVAQIDLDRQCLLFAGVGNISGVLCEGQKERWLLSYNGTLGHRVHKIQELAFPWHENALLVLHSDGLAARWKLEDSPGLKQRHPAVIAGALYRDFSRNRDDAAVTVVRQAAG